MLSSRQVINNLFPTTIPPGVHSITQCVLHSYFYQMPDTTTLVLVSTSILFVFRVMARRRVTPTPLAFWRAHAWTMPHLAVVAQHVLGVPASTANIERLFSAAGRAVSKR